MNITWLGHSSFLLEDTKGRKVLIDPFDPSLGYKVYTGEADIITISHQHFDHNYTKEVKGTPVIMDKVGFFYEKDINITGIPSYHDRLKGAKRGENTIFIIQMDDYRVCHLGDLGHLLEPEAISKIGNVDVLLIPVGGNFTINGEEASQVAKLINSHIVIPMHFKTSQASLPIEGAENFVLNMKNGEKLGSNTLKLDEPLQDFNKVLILQY